MRWLGQRREAITRVFRHTSSEGPYNDNAGCRETPTHRPIMVDDIDDKGQTAVTRHPMPAIIGRDAHTWPAQIGGTERLLATATATAHTRNQQMRLEVPPDASYPGPLLTSFLVGERVPCPYMYGEIGSQARVAGCAAAATSYGLRTRAGDAALREVESR